MRTQLHFLVVDDVPMLRHTAIASLKALGYTRISEAGDGEQALRLLRSADASATPIDFVVTDWNMPGMDGIALLRAIRASAKWRHLAILMVSTYAEEDDRAAAMHAGVDGYLVKPLDAGILKAALDDILAGRG